MKHRHAFTLIELLVVISIIILLAGMILGAAGVIREAAKRSRTAAIQGVIQQALFLHGAKMGGLPSAAEHPLAGSLAPRTAFVRAGGAHDPVATSGQALTGASTTTDLSSAGDHLLLDDDIFADVNIPALYGMPRSRLGILGQNTSDVTGYNRIKHLPTPIDPTSPSNFIAVNPAETPAAREALLRFWLPGGAWDELVKLNAIFTPADDDAGHRIANGRVWCPESSGLAASPMRINDSGTWKTYRLRGTSLIDAWGREMLFSIRDDKTLMIESAGKDGFFRWNPGKDGVFQTDAWGPPAGDDSDASLDNVTLGRP